MLWKDLQNATFCGRCDALLRRAWFQENGENGLVSTFIEHHYISRVDNNEISPVGVWMNKIKDRDSYLKIVVRDSCQSFALPINEMPRNTMFFYSNTPQTVASDSNLQRNSGLFTVSLLRNIKRSGLSVEEIFQET